jgi:hypothetical protein
MLTLYCNGAQAPGQAPASGRMPALKTNTMEEFEL